MTEASRVDEEADEEQKTEKERTITPSAGLCGSMGFASAVDTRMLPKPENFNNNDLNEEYSAHASIVPKTSHCHYENRKESVVRAETVDKSVGGPGASDTSSVVIMHKSGRLTVDSAAAKNQEHMLLTDDHEVMQK